MALFERPYHTVTPKIGLFRVYQQDRWVILGPGQQGTRDGYLIK